MARQLVTRMFGSRVGVAMLTGLAALTVAATAFATIPDADGMIHGCYNLQGELRVIDDDIRTCRPNETAVSWSQSGIVGYEVVTESRDVPPAASTVVHAQCTPGKRVLGGGYHSNNVLISQSFPQLSGGIHRWQVAATADAPGSSGTVSAWAICAFATP